MRSRAPAESAPGTAPTAGLRPPPATPQRPSPGGCSPPVRPVSGQLPWEPDLPGPREPRARCPGRGHRVRQGRPPPDPRWGSTPQPRSSPRRSRPAEGPTARPPPEGPRPAGSGCRAAVGVQRAETAARAGAVADPGRGTAEGRSPGPRHAALPPGHRRVCSAARRRAVPERCVPSRAARGPAARTRCVHSRSGGPDRRARSSSGRRALRRGARRNPERRGRIRPDRQCWGRRPARSSRTPAELRLEVRRSHAGSPLRDRRPPRGRSRR